MLRQPFPSRRRSHHQHSKVSNIFIKAPAAQRRKPNKEERKGKLCYETFLIDQTKRRRFFTDTKLSCPQISLISLGKDGKLFPSPRLLFRLQFERNTEAIEIQLAKEFLHTLFVWLKAHFRRMEDDEKFPFWEDKIDDEDETFPKESDFLLTIDILLSSAQQEQVCKFNSI